MVEHNHISWHIYKDIVKKRGEVNSKLEKCIKEGIHDGYLSFTNSNEYSHVIHLYSLGYHYGSVWITSHNPISTERIKYHKDKMVELINTKKELEKKLSNFMSKVKNFECIISAKSRLKITHEKTEVFTEQVVGFPKSSRTIITTTYLTEPELRNRFKNIVGDLPFKLNINNVSKYIEICDVKKPNKVEIRFDKLPFSIYEPIFCIEIIEC